MNESGGAYALLRLDLMASLRTDHPDWNEDILSIYEQRLAEVLRALGSKVGAPSQPTRLKSIGQIR
ncbi:MAG: hypothetical protein INR62_03920 [Rhodospirillales bacterium]|nr:hypothetical protein [Acetobacter sp.]